MNYYMNFDCTNSTQHTKRPILSSSYPLASRKKLNKGERQRRDLRDHIFYDSIRVFVSQWVCSFHTKRSFTSLCYFPLFFRSLASPRHPLLIRRKQKTRYRGILSLPFGLRSSFRSRPLPGRSSLLFAIDFCLPPPPPPSIVIGRNRRLNLAWLAIRDAETRRARGRGRHTNVNAHDDVDVKWHFKGLVAFNLLAVN